MLQGRRVKSGKSVGLGIAKAGHRTVEPVGDDGASYGTDGEKETTMTFEQQFPIQPYYWKMASNLYPQKNMDLKGAGHQRDSRQSSPDSMSEHARMMPVGNAQGAVEVQAQRLDQDARGSNANAEPRMNKTQKLPGKKEWDNIKVQQVALDVGAEVIL